MRKLITILLLALLALTQTPLGQLVKLPVLIEHFYKHRRYDGVSLSEFLNNHYASEHNDGDQSEDERLPFKTIVFHPVDVAVVPRILRTEMSICSETQAKSIFPDIYTPQQHLCNIFHPPRA